MSGGEILQALLGDVGSAPQGRRLRWWRTHQLAVMALYVVAATIAWHIKEKVGGSISVWLFVAIGMGAAINGIVRGHLVFTERMNRRRLARERERTGRSAMVIDLLIAASLFADGVVLAQVTPLWAVLTMGLAFGIALAALLMEPATSEAAFGDNRA